MVRNDPLWKGIIQELIFPFLTFFFPEEKFDFSLEPEFLDKELEQIYPREDTDPKRRLVDKLVKVWTDFGEEKWILIHVEVQGYQDKSLPQRMFQCFYRILDSFKMPVTSLVIYTDTDPGYYPDTYQYKLLDTSLNFSFATYKVLSQSEAELEKSDNPFALIILTVLESIKIYDELPEQQIETKLKLVHLLIKKNYDRTYIRSMMTFIRFYVQLMDEEMNLKFEKRVEQLVTNKNIPMGVEEILLQQAEEKGIEKGMEKGMEKLKEAARNMLNEGFEISLISKVLEVPNDFILAVQAEN